MNTAILRRQFGPAQLPIVEGSKAGAGVAAMLGCGHVFDLLMRRIHVPLAKMPCPSILGPNQLHALEAPGWK
jgi:hypothetical protein